MGQNMPDNQSVILYGMAWDPTPCHGIVDAYQNEAKQYSMHVE